jgi:predicted permease
MAMWLRGGWWRVRSLISRERLDREFDDELATHLSLLEDEYRRRGFSDADARSAARRALGRPAAIREAHREQRGLPLLDVLGQDVRSAVRSLWTDRAFTTFATLSLALGIGASTVLFSLVDGLLLRALAVRAPDRLVVVQPTISRLGIHKAFTLGTAPALEAIRARRDVFSEVVGFQPLHRPVIAIDGATEPGRSIDRVSDNFFSDLGVTPLIGRVPSSGEDGVALISEPWWRARFAGRTDTLGRPLMIDERSYTIIGITPGRFRGLSLDSGTDAWIVSRTPAPLQVVARLAPGVSAQHARSAAEALFQHLARTQAGSPAWGDDMHIVLVPAGRGLSFLRQQYERPLVALSALVLLVLLMTCTNVGNLLVLRYAARRRELAIRVALGAGRARLLVMYLVESLLLAVLGGALALALAGWGVSAVLAMLPLDAPPEALAFRADPRVLGFAAGVSLVSALLFGLAPAWRAAQGDTTTVLRSSAGKGATQGSRRLGRWLVGGQVALSVLLLVPAGLFVQTLRNLSRVDVGFEADGLLQVSLDTRGAGYGRGQVGPLQARLLDRVAAIPGVRAVSVIRNGVMQSAGTRSRLTLPGRTLPPDEAWNGAEVGPGFFETMAIPVRRGRTFAAADFAQGRRVVVVTEAWARRYFPNAEPIGARIGDAPHHEIVGVVADSRIFDVRSDVGPTMFFVAPPEPDRFSALEARIAGDMDGVARAIQVEIRRINPRLVVGVRSMRQEMDRSVAKERLVAAISAGFGLLGLLLASVGIFGVAASTVARRTPELGIRMALGADRWTVVRDALRETMLVIVAGLGAGIAAAAMAVRLGAALVGDLLFGLSASDAATVAGAALVMLIVGAAACALPGRRAARIDPLAAIRDP